MNHAIAGASDMAHVCNITSGLVLVILRCQDSASSSAGSPRPSTCYNLVAAVGYRGKNTITLTHSFI